MIFQAHSKSLHLVMVAGRKEIDKSAGIPIVINHPQRMVTWQDWRYETEDPEIIDWLKRHSMFSDAPSRPGTFWVFVQPRNLQAELDAKEAENAVLRAALEGSVPAPSSSPTEPSVPATQASVPAAIVKPPFCDSCPSKGTFHRKDCPKKEKKIEVVASPILVTV